MCVESMVEVNCSPVTLAKLLVDPTDRCTRIVASKPVEDRIRILNLRSSPIPATRIGLENWFVVLGVTETSCPTVVTRNRVPCATSWPAGVPCVLLNNDRSARRFALPAMALASTLVSVTFGLRNGPSSGMYSAMPQDCAA